MTLGKYEALDEAILSFIADTKAATGRNGVKATQGEMMNHQAISAQAQRLAISANKDLRIPAMKPSFRFVDGRLQALKRAGKIRYLGAGMGWATVEKRKL
jgi:hypothetical protein